MGTGTLRLPAPLHAYWARSPLLPYSASSPQGQGHSSIPTTNCTPLPTSSLATDRQKAGVQEAPRDQVPAHGEGGRSDVQSPTPNGGRIGKLPLGPIVHPGGPVGSVSGTWTGIKPQTDPLDPTPPVTRWNLVTRTLPYITPQAQPCTRTPPGPHSSSTPPLHKPQQPLSESILPLFPHGAELGPQLSILVPNPTLSIPPGLKSTMQLSPRGVNIKRGPTT